MAAIFTLFAFVLWVIFVDFYSNVANALLTVHPKDTVVVVNQLTYFNCSTSDRNLSANAVLWYHYHVGSVTRNDVYDDGFALEYKDRFSIETSLAEGVFNLLVERPNLSDAGRYECQDKVGQGDKASAELIILDGKPKCESNMNPDGVIGPNDCGLEPDEIQLTCNVTSSHGNILPTLEWKKSGDESSSSLVVCERSTPSCKLTIRADLTFNSKSFVCQTTNARRQQYGCSVGPIKVKYAISSTEEIKEAQGDVECIANASQPCTYKWYNDKNEKVSSEANLGEQNPGVVYQCEAECEVSEQNKSCIFITMRVKVPLPDPRPLALLALLLIPIVFLVGFYLYKRHKSKNKRLSKSDDNSLKDEIVTDDAAFSSANSSAVQPLMTTPPYDEVDSRPKEPSSTLPSITDQAGVEKLTVNEHFIDRGTSGAIYGPFEWKNKKCAIKQILYSPDKVTEEKQDEINELIDHCKKLYHLHLVKVFEVWFPSPALYILMEYAEGKSLDKILRPKDASSPLPPFEHETVQDWALQIADGMRYLHGRKLVHRNLKAAHVLVMETPDVSSKTLKIGSYTLAKDHDHSTVMSLKGTMAWMAPEYIRGEPFSTLSDVWSYGVTVWEILTRDIPYKEMRKETDLVRAAINKTLKLKIPDSCPEQLRSLLTECWNYEVGKRPSFEEICDRFTVCST